MPSSSSPTKVTGPRCPVCFDKPAAEEFRPFCSQRCKNIDLNRWLSGVYSIPAVEAEEDELEAEREAEPKVPQRER